VLTLFSDVLSGIFEPVSSPQHKYLWYLSVATAASLGSEPAPFVQEGETGQVVSGTDAGLSLLMGAPHPEPLFVRIVMQDSFIRLCCMTAPPRRPLSSPDHGACLLRCGSMVVDFCCRGNVPCAANGYDEGRKGAAERGSQCSAAVHASSAPADRGMLLVSNEPVPG